MIYGRADKYIIFEKDDSNSELSNKFLVNFKYEWVKIEYRKDLKEKKMEIWHDVLPY